jgi:proline iminopeptidase
MIVVATTIESLITLDVSDPHEIRFSSNECLQKVGAPENQRNLMITRRRLLTLAPRVAAALNLTLNRKSHDTERDIGLEKNFSRKEAVRTIAEARRIVRPGGIERLEAVEIGGIKQWMSIRGADVNNPILLYIHGGPGYVSMPMNWWFGRGWEEYFTVVHWDQRGAGKTYLLNDPSETDSTLTLKRMQADVAEMISSLLRDLGQKKMFVLGHSWGSCLGLRIAQQYPHLLHAYIGVGQITNGPESERRGWASTINAARRDGNAEAVNVLQAIAPYFAPGQPAPLKDIYTQRRWLDYYGGVMAYRRGNSAESDLSKLSPDYSSEEITHVWDGNEPSEHALLATGLSTDLTAIQQLECPLILFAGRHDTNVNSSVAAEWFANVHAPIKHFVWFEHSAHLPMTEEPGKFLTSLLCYARPLGANSLTQEAREPF